jgi:hypothetical protein
MCWYVLAERDMTLLGLCLSSSNIFIRKAPPALSPDNIPMKSLSTNINLGIARFQLRLHPLFL